MRRGSQKPEDSERTVVSDRGHNASERADKEHPDKERPGDRLSVDWGQKTGDRVRKIRISDCYALER